MQHGPSAVLLGFALQACCKKSHKSHGCGRLVAIEPLETADWPIVFAICGPWCFVFATNATWGQMPATFSVHCPAEPCNLIGTHRLPLSPAALATARLRMSTNVLNSLTPASIALKQPIKLTKPIYIPTTTNHNTHIHHTSITSP